MLQARREISRWLRNHAGHELEGWVRELGLECDRRLFENDMSLSRYYARIGSAFGARLHADRALAQAEGAGLVAHAAEARAHIDSLASLPEVSGESTWGGPGVLVRRARGDPGPAVRPAVAYRLLSPVLLLAPACGWNTGLVPTEHTGSVGVEVTASPTTVLERDLEPILSDAFTQAVVDLVDAPLAPPRSADLVLRGHVQQYRRRGGIRNRENQLRETGLFVQVTAELVDGRTGGVVVPAKQAQVWNGYAIDSASLRNEAEARERAFRYVAESLVLDLFASRPPPPPDDGQESAASAAGANTARGGE